MKLHKRLNQYIVIILSFLMAFEPFAINMVRAAETPKPFVETLDTEGIEGIVDLEEVEKPAEYLEYMLSLRDRSRSDDAITAKSKDEAIAWGEWMNTISGVYALMDDGCTDVFTFYNTLGEITPHINNTPYYFRGLAFASNKAILSMTFLGNKLSKAFPGVVTAAKSVAGWTSHQVEVIKGAIKGSAMYRKGAGWVQSKANLMNGFKKMGNAYQKTSQAFSASNVTTFFTHLCPPVGFKAGCETGEGFVSYWRWIARKTNLDGNPAYKEAMKKVNSHLSAENQICTNKGAYVMKDAKGIAHTVGIGLTILGIAMDTYGIVSSEDRQGGRYGSYGLVKNYVGLALGVASLVAMFCIPIVGQVIGVLALIWTALTIIGDQIGEYNKKWKAAYKNSYWFLYQNDPEFKSFYDNREVLTQDEKSACMLIVDKNYGTYKEAALKFQRDNKNDNNYYDDSSEEAISSRVYLELEKQGILTSYYNKGSFKMPDYGMTRLQEMWDMKADYMSWKPTEEESVRAQNRGFWGKIGHAINPMTYISWAGDKIKSHEYKKTIEKYNYEKVYFNPDFVLNKKYQTWITANKKMENTDSEDNNDDFYRAIGLRIEQSPFNYIPLVGIDMASWDEELFVQAFNADAFQIGVKEMIYFRNIMDQATEAVEEGTKECSKTVKAMKESTDFFRDRAEALAGLRDAYKEDPDKKIDSKLNKKLKNAFGWKWNKKNGDQTPANVIKVYWTDINQSITYDSLSISQKGAECQMLLDTIKKNLDTAVLMRELVNEKRDSLELKNFNSEFRNEDLNKYLKEGTFLTVKGSTFWDWLSDLYPAYDELEKYTNLFEDKVEDFEVAANDSNTGHKKVLFFTVESDEHHPAAVLKDINATIANYKSCTEDFENIANELGLDGLGVSSEDTGIYTEYNACEVVALDPNAAVIPEFDND